MRYHQQHRRDGQPGQHRKADAEGSGVIAESRAVILGVELFPHRGEPQQRERHSRRAEIAQHNAESLAADAFMSGRGRVLYLLIYLRDGEHRLRRAHLSIAAIVYGAADLGTVAYHNLVGAQIQVASDATVDNDGACGNVRAALNAASYLNSAARGEKVAPDAAEYVHIIARGKGIVLSTAAEDKLVACGHEVLAAALYLHIAARGKLHAPDLCRAIHAAAGGEQGAVIAAGGAALSKASAGGIRKGGAGHRRQHCQRQDERQHKSDLFHFVLFLHSLLCHSLNI